MLGLLLILYVGFDEKEEELIFKPFSQIDGSSTRAHGGSGLGLVISRQLVELHGGTMGAKSTKGEGSWVSHPSPLKYISNSKQNILLFSEVESKP